MKRILITCLLLPAMHTIAQTEDAQPGYDLYSYFSAHFNYPAIAKDCRAEGSVMVNFTIDSTGAISNCHVVNNNVHMTIAADSNGVCDVAGIMKTCGDVAVKLVAGMPRWHAKLQEGKPLASNGYIPVSFVLPKAGESGTAYKVHFAATPYTFVEHMPVPGFDFNKYIQDNLQYPQAAKAKGIQGTVTVQVVINEDGSITDCKVLKGIGDGCDEEALRIVKLMPHWQPGRQHYLPVPVLTTVMIKFSLAE
ncbi:MAG: TonB family protein [Bacteroidetes bacterium]|nr:TonB family protein [Bacteroidota bacterium]